MQVQVDETGRTFLVPCSQAAASSTTPSLTPSKRHYDATLIEQPASLLVPPPSPLLQLQDQCLLNLMQFLDRNDLCRTALTCQRLNTIRNHDTLDQARMQVLGVGEVVAAVKAAVLQSSPGPYQALLDRFRGNYSICYLYFTDKNIGNRDVLDKFYEQRPRPIANITHLVVPTHPGMDEADFAHRLGWYVAFELGRFVFKTMPNIRYAAMYACADPLEQQVCDCQLLHTLRWLRARISSIHGDRIPRDLVNLYLPQCVLMMPDQIHVHANESVDAKLNQIFAQERYDYLLFRSQRQLQKVDLKGGRVGVYATFAFHNGCRKPVVRPIPQAMLVQFVRRHAPQSLRWFSSDLTAENVALLQAEFPHMTFV